MSSALLLYDDYQKMKSTEDDSSTVVFVNKSMDISGPRGHKLDYEIKLYGPTLVWVSSYQEVKEILEQNMNVRVVKFLYLNFLDKEHLSNIGSFLAKIVSLEFYNCRILGSEDIHTLVVQTRCLQEFLYTSTQTIQGLSNTVQAILDGNNALSVLKICEKQSVDEWNLQFKQSIKSLHVRLGVIGNEFWTTLSATSQQTLERFTSESHTEQHHQIIAASFPTINYLRIQTTVTEGDIATQGIPFANVSVLAVAYLQGVTLENFGAIDCLNENLQVLDLKNVIISEEATFVQLCNTCINLRILRIQVFFKINETVSDSFSQLKLLDELHYMVGVVGRTMQYDTELDSRMAKVVITIPIHVFVTDAQIGVKTVEAFARKATDWPTFHFFIKISNYVRNVLKPENLHWIVEHEWDDFFFTFRSDYHDWMRLIQTQIESPEQEPEPDRVATHVWESVVPHLTIQDRLRFRGLSKEWREKMLKKVDTLVFVNKKRNFTGFKGNKCDYEIQCYGQHLVWVNNYGQCLRLIKRCKELKCIKFIHMDSEDTENFTKIGSYISKIESIEFFDCHNLEAQHLHNLLSTSGSLKEFLFTEMWLTQNLPNVIQLVLDRNPQLEIFKLIQSESNQEWRLQFKQPLKSIYIELRVIHNDFWTSLETSSRHSLRSFTSDFYTQQHHERVVSSFPNLQYIRFKASNPQPTNIQFQNLVVLGIRYGVLTDLEPILAASQLQNKLQVFDSFNLTMTQPPTLTSICKSCPNLQVLRIRVRFKLTEEMVNSLRQLRKLEELRYVLGMAGSLIEDDGQFNDLMAVVVRDLNLRVFGTDMVASTKCVNEMMTKARQDPKRLYFIQISGIKPEKEEPENLKWILKHEWTDFFFTFRSNYLDWKILSANYEPTPVEPQPETSEAIATIETVFWREAFLYMPLADRIRLTAINKEWQQMIYPTIQRIVFIDKDRNVFGETDHRHEYEIQKYGGDILWASGWRQVNQIIQKCINLKTVKFIHCRAHEEDFLPQIGLQFSTITSLEIYKCDLLTADLMLSIVVETRLLTEFTYVDNFHDAGMPNAIQRVLDNNPLLRKLKLVELWEVQAWSLQFRQPIESLHVRLIIHLDTWTSLLNTSRHSLKRFISESYTLEQHERLAAGFKNLVHFGYEASLELFVAIPYEVPFRNLRVLTMSYPHHAVFEDFQNTVYLQSNLEVLDCRRIRITNGETLINICNTCPNLRFLRFEIGFVLTHNVVNSLQRLRNLVELQVEDDGSHNVNDTVYDELIASVIREVPLRVFLTNTVVGMVSVRSMIQKAFYDPEQLYFVQFNTTLVNEPETTSSNLKWLVAHNWGEFFTGFRCEYFEWQRIKCEGWR